MSGSKNVVETFSDVAQDLLVPELKAVKVSVDSLRTEMKLNTEALREELKLTKDTLREELSRNSEALREELKLTKDMLREKLRLNNEALREELRLNIGSLREEIRFRNESLEQTIRLELERNASMTQKLSENSTSPSTSASASPPWKRVCPSSSLTGFPRLADLMSSPHPPADITSKLAELWHRKLPQTSERLSLLDQAATAATNGTLTSNLQAQASSLAHTFAGSLGTFGYHEATRLARELEQHWDSPSPNPAALAELTARLRKSLPLL